MRWLYAGQLGDIPAYVLIPQLSSAQKDWIAASDAVAGLIRETAETYAVDQENISLTGSAWAAQAHGSSARRTPGCLPGSRR